MRDSQLYVETTISQDGKADVIMNMGPSPQLQAMLTSLEQGMVFVTGYWSAPDMNWLDRSACGSGPERCSGGPARISNWRITSNSQRSSRGTCPNKGDCFCEWASEDPCSRATDDGSECFCRCCCEQKYSGDISQCGWSPTTTRRLPAEEQTTSDEQMTTTSMA